MAASILGLRQERQHYSLAVNTIDAHTKEYVSAAYLICSSDPIGEIKPSEAIDRFIGELLLPDVIGSPPQARRLQGYRGRSDIPYENIFPQYWLTQG